MSSISESTVDLVIFLAHNDLFVRPLVMSTHGECRLWASPGWYGVFSVVDKDRGQNVPLNVSAAGFHLHVFGKQCVSLVNRG